jgi:glycosyltransferase involved in cell wall biosynthesis
MAARMTRAMTAPIQPGTQRPTFGLVIPTYRRPSFARDAVRSALAQTRSFDRIIVVCDGPQADTQAALAEYDVTVITIDNAGVSAARNAGVAALTTDWVCFLDDDDLLLPSYLQTVELGLEEYPEVQAGNAAYWVMGDSPGPGVDFQATDYDSALRNLPPGEPERSLHYMFIYGRSFDLLLEHMRGSLSGTVVRRDVLLKAGGFDESLRCAEDWSMYVNVARLTEWGTHAGALVVFREHSAVSSTVHGGPRNGLDTLRAAASFWAPTTLPTPAHRDLREYRENYRFILRWTLDVCREAGDRASYREALSIARAILPRRWDRILSRVPHRTWEQWRTRRPRWPVPTAIGD